MFPLDKDETSIVIYKSAHMSGSLHGYNVYLQFGLIVKMWRCVKGLGWFGFGLATKDKTYRHNFPSRNGFELYYVIFGIPSKT